MIFIQIAHQLYIYIVVYILLDKFHQNYQTPIGAVEGAIWGWWSSHFKSLKHWPRCCSTWWNNLVCPCHTQASLDSLACSSCPTDISWPCMALLPWSRPAREVDLYSNREFFGYQRLPLQSHNQWCWQRDVPPCGHRIFLACSKPFLAKVSRIYKYIPRYVDIILYYIYICSLISLYILQHTQYNHWTPCRANHGVSSPAQCRVFSPGPMGRQQGAWPGLVDMHWKHGRMPPIVAGCCWCIVEKIDVPGRKNPRCSMHLLG